MKNRRKKRPRGQTKKRYMRWKQEKGTRSGAGIQAMKMAALLLLTLCTKPKWSAARANVFSLLCVRPMPPPTITLKPRSSVDSIRGMVMVEVAGNDKRVRQTPKT